MPIVIIDNRTTIDEADSLTNWTGPSDVETEFAEGTGSVAGAINIASDEYFYTTASPIDMHAVTGSTLFYVYTTNTAIQATWESHYHTLLIGDGTNQVGFDMAGSDRQVFSHSDGPVIWQSFVLDTAMASGMDTAGHTTEYAGTFAALDFINLEDFGVGFITLSKALGGGFNCLVDILRYGNDGITVTSGTVANPGTFLDVAVEDRDTADGKGFGIIRELGTGLYGVQGPLNLGSGLGSIDCRFEDSGFVISFENRDIDDDKYYMAVRGNTTSGTHVFLDNATVTTAGPKVELDFSSDDIDDLEFDNIVFTGLGNAATFGNDTAAQNHRITSCSFIGQGQVDPGKTRFLDNVISNGTNITGDMLLDDDGSSNLSGITFNSDGLNGHAIYIPVTGTFGLRGLTYSGYGSTGTTGAVVWNNSSGLVTLNITAGESPTYLNGLQASTVINNNISITLTNLVSPTEVRVYDDGTTTELHGEENVTGGSFAFSQGASDVVDIRIFAVPYLPADIIGYTIPATDTSIPIQQIFDRNYGNP